jgi:hypothetical protein
LKADEEFSIEGKCMMAFSFLKKKEIPVYFAELYLELSPDACLLADWVNKHYVNGENNRPSSFLPAFWSCSDLNKQQIPRTQNFAESFHHHFHQVLGISQAGVYR